MSRSNFPLLKRKKKKKGKLACPIIETSRSRFSSIKDEAIVSSHTKLTTQGGDGEGGEALCTGSWSWSWSMELVQSVNLVEIGWS